MWRKTLLTAVRPTAETWQVGNEAAGISALVAPLATRAPAWVVREATRGFEGPLLAALAVAAGPVVRANPRQVRAFAQAIGILAQPVRPGAFDESTTRLGIARLGQAALLTTRPTGLF
jgi:hypothetical protein